MYSVSRNARSRVVHVTLLGPTHWRSGCYRCCSTLCACAERWSNALSTCGVLLSIFTSLSTAVCQPEYITSLWSLFTSFHIPAVYSRVYSSVYSRVYSSVYSRVYSSVYSRVCSSPSTCGVQCSGLTSHYLHAYAVIHSIFSFSSTWNIPCAEIQPV